MLAAGVNWVIGQTYGSRWLEAVQLCLDLGFDVNAVNQMGLAAVHGAANRGSDDVIELLASRGARLDVADKEGRTPATWAEGVFLATNSPIAKPSTIALLGRLTQPMRPLLVSAAFVFALSALTAGRGWPAASGPGGGSVGPGAGPGSGVSQAGPAPAATTTASRRGRCRSTGWTWLPWTVTPTCGRRWSASCGPG